jgi:predicted ATPase
MKIHVSLVLGMLLWVSVYKNESSLVKAASEEQSTTANTEAQQREREEYVKSIQTKLDEYDRKVNGLETRASTMSGPAKDDFRNMIEQLQVQKKAIASRLAYIKNASPDTFSLIKAYVDSTLANVERSYQEVSKKLETTPASPSRTQQK